MPTMPTRIDDWGASALSTRKIRVDSAAATGAGGLRGTTFFGRQFRKAASSLRRSADSVVSPATISAALLGR